MRILFRGDRILAHDDVLNAAEVDITRLVRVVSQYDLLAIHNVPDSLYHAWKILVLGSQEHDARAYAIVSTAARRLNERR